MKKLLFLLLIWLYPIFSFGTINECLTDVYFANGIATNEGNATANAYLLKLAIMDEIYKENDDEFNNNIGKVAYAYNNTHGFLIDGLETFYQKFGWQALLDLLHPSHKTDLSLQIRHYKESIQSGHKVLAVAHSQGNLYTYEAHQGLDDWMSNYFEAISIASPMQADIKTGTPPIDWDNDIVSRIRTLGESVGGAIPNKVRKVDWILQDSPIHHSEGMPSSNYIYQSLNQGKSGDIIPIYTTIQNGKSCIS